MRLWDRIRGLANGRTRLWMCVGDYNEIARATEKEGGRPKQQRVMDAFNSMMQYTGLVDMGFCGTPYTWTNKREGDQRISERLDRAIANSAFIGQYPNLRVTHKLLLGSDHGPLVIQMDPSMRRGRDGSGLKVHGWSNKVVPR